MIEKWVPFSDGQALYHQGRQGRVWPCVRPIRVPGKRFDADKPPPVEPTGRWGATWKDRTVRGPRYYNTEQQAKEWVTACVVKQPEPNGQVCVICGDNDHQAFECRWGEGVTWTISPQITTRST